MADYGKFENSFFGGVYVVLNTDDIGTNTFDLSLLGGVFLCVEKTSAAQLREEVGSSGAIAGGVSTSKRIFAPATSDGAIAGGSGDSVSIRKEASTGGAVVGGSAVVDWIVATQLLEVTMSGGAVVGGLAPIIGIRVEESAGGAVANYQATLAVIRVEVASGGAVAGGSISITAAETVVGGAVAGGAATIVRVCSAVSIGGVVAGGAAYSGLLSSRACEGGAVTGGQSDIAVTSIALVDGGAVSGGQIDAPTWYEDLPDDDLLSYDNIRQIIKAPNTGVSLRIRLAGSSIAPVTISGASWGPRSGNTGNFASAPVRLTFNGGEYGVTIPAGGTVYTDWVAADVTKNATYLFHLSLADSSNWMKVKETGQIKEYYKLSGVDDTLTQVISGYSTSTRATAVVSVEIYRYRIEVAATEGGAIAGCYPDNSFVTAEERRANGGAVAGGVAPYSAVLAGLQEMVAASIGGAIAGGTRASVVLSVIAATGGAVSGGTGLVRVGSPALASEGGAVASGECANVRVAKVSSVSGGVSGGHAEISLIGSSVVVLGVGGGVAGGVANLLTVALKPTSAGAVAGGYASLILRVDPEGANALPHWHVDDPCETPVWMLKKDANWVETRGEGPWPFSEQPDKWGYINNPRWKRLD